MNTEALVLATIAVGVIGILMGTALIIVSKKMNKKEKK